MHRLLLAAIVSVSTLFADAVTLTTCTAGPTTVSPCPGSFSFPGGIDGAMAGAAASDNSVVAGVLPSSVLPLITGQTLSAAADAIVSGSNSYSVMASAQAAGSNTYNTGGPVGSGFIQFDVQLDHFHGGDASVQFSDGVHSYDFGLLSGSTPSTYCNIDGCGYTATVPIDLGVDLQVISSADVSEASSAGAGGLVDHGSVDAVVTFRLLASDGVTPVSFYAVPEPSTGGLLMLSAVVCWLSWRSAYNRLHKTH